LDNKDMASTKRNDLCPCGSGKKYKKCCGASEATRASVAGSPREATPFTGVPGMQVQMSLPMALHGQNQYIVFEPLPGLIPVGGGAPGTYKVVFTLSRPGFPLRPEGKFTCEQNLEGDSHLYIRIKRDTVEIVFAVHTANGAFDFHGVPNRSGNLGKLWTEHVVAKDYYEAERIAWTALSPALSWLAVHLDVPLFVEQVDVIDRHTGGQAIKVLLAYSAEGHWPRAGQIFGSCDGTFCPEVRLMDKHLS
jgi:SEC-C motif